MAQFVNLTVASGSLELVNTTENTSSAGYMWFDSVSGSFKYSAYSGSGVWSTSGTLNTGRRLLAGIGVQNASLAVGGGTSSLLCYCNNTEEYNGSSWSNGPVISNARFGLSSSPKGSTNSGLVAGGAEPPVDVKSSRTEEYDGISWNNGGNLSTARNYLGGAGTQNSTLAFGGCTGTPRTTATEEYNGTSWASGGALPTVVAVHGGTGTQNAALSIGGLSSPTPILSTTNEYNGTSWSAGGTFGAKYGMGAAGTQNEAIAFGGLQPNNGAAKEYDGAAWTTVNSLSSARYYIPGTGTQNAALTFGGAPGSSTTTQEYTKAPCIVDL